MQYEGWVNPYGASIGDTIARSHDAEAHAAEMTAQAAARAAEIKAAAWGGAVQNIANIPAQIEQQQRQNRDSDMIAKLRQTEIDKNAQDVAGRTRAQQGQQLLGTLTQKYGTPDPNTGVVDIDHEAVANELTKAGFGDEAQRYLHGASQAAEDVNTIRAGRKAAADATTIALARAAKNATGPSDMINTLDHWTAAKAITPAERQTIFQSLQQAGPDGWESWRKNAVAGGDQLAPHTVVKKDERVLGGVSGDVIADNSDPLEGAYTINGQRFRKDGTPIGAAVPKQAEPPKIGSPEDYVATYAKEKFGIDPAKMTVAQKDEALGAFKSANADQDMRDAALAQKNIAAALAQMQLSQQPTKEQAASVADDLVNHRISPDQLTSLFSTRGKEGLAFKLQVTAEAKKLDPTFNFEEAQANYSLSKSTGFQNTVRYMDSALESIPQLLKNSQNLGNGNFRSWTELANAAKNQFNSTDLKRFKTDALLVGDEIAKILSGGGTGSATSDAKLKQATDIIGTSDSVPSIAAAMQEVQVLMGNRRRALTRGTYMERLGESEPAAAPAPALTPGLQKLKDRP